MANIVIHVPVVEASSAAVVATKKIEPVVVPVHPMPVPATTIDHLHWIDPVLANALNYQFVTPNPVPKDELPTDALIAMSTPVGLLTQFQSAKDASQVYYLPAFAVWTDQQAVGVRFAAVPGSTGWRLDVTLVEEIPDHFRLIKTAKLGSPLQTPTPPTRFYLTYEAKPGIVVNHDFDTAVFTADPAGYHLSLTVDTIAKRNDIYWAMSARESNCRLIVLPTLN